MKTTTSHLSLLLSVSSLTIVGTILLGSSPASTRSTLRASTPDFEYARLIFTTAPASTLAWINTPLGAATANVGKQLDGTLEPIQSAIRATSTDAGFDELGAGRPMDDMMLVQWMGLANWELVAVTQDQIAQGTTTSFFFKRLK